MKSTEEDLDYAIALSLSEANIDSNIYKDTDSSIKISDIRTPSTPNVKDSTEKNGGSTNLTGILEGLFPNFWTSLSNSRNESVEKKKSGSKTESSNTSTNLHSKDINRTEQQSKMCERCKNPIGFGAFITALGNKYHSHCFRCLGCDQLIDTTFAVQGDPPQPYHHKCYGELFLPRCSVCDQPIQGMHFTNPFFDDEKYCIDHESQPSCFSCRRKEPLKSTNKEPFLKLLDGRSLCGECSSTIIMDSTEACSIYQQIISFMENQLMFKIPEYMRDVPILTVDIQSLNENRKSGCGQIHQDFEGSTTRGLTLSTVGEIRHYVSRMGLMNGFMPEKSVYKIETVRDVTAVLILYGLPKDLAASIIAHEALHVWIKLTKDFPLNLPGEVEEGLCQLIAYLYLQNLSIQPKSPGHSVREEVMRQFYRHQIEKDPNPIYGDGYRFAAKCLDALGLEVLLDHVKQTSQFPEL